MNHQPELPQSPDREGGPEKAPEPNDALLPQNTRARPEVPPGAASEAALAPIKSKPDTEQGVGFFSIPTNRASGGLSGTHVVVAGFGAIGSWVALRAAYEGANVTVVDDREFQTYLVAAGWVMPYHATDPRAASWALEAMKLWSNYASKARSEPAGSEPLMLPEEAVTWEWTTLERAAAADPFPPEFRALRDYEPMTSVAKGLKEGFTAQTPVAPARIWHRYLRRVLENTDGVNFVNRHIGSAEEMDDLAEDYDADFVVDATGITPAFLYDDRKFLPQYGAVVHLRMPAGWEGGVRSRDLAEPASGFGIPGTSDPYLITQRALGVIVVGGTMWPMTLREVDRLIESNFEVGEGIADGVLRRAIQHFPELRGLEYVRAECSVRPSRDEFLLGWDRQEPRLMHASGFGGSGVTLAPVVSSRIVLGLINRRANQPGC